MNHTLQELVTKHSGSRILGVDPRDKIFGKLPPVAILLLGKKRLCLYEATLLRELVAKQKNS